MENTAIISVHLVLLIPPQAKVHFVTLRSTLLVEFSLVGKVYKVLEARTDGERLHAGNSYKYGGNLVVSKVI